MKVWLVEREREERVSKWARVSGGWDSVSVVGGKEEEGDGD